MLRVVADHLRHIPRCVDPLVHPMATADCVLLRRHRTFIFGHLGGGMLALLAMPLVLAFHGPAQLPLVMLFAWAMAQIPLAMMVSRTGAIAKAQGISALLSAGVIAALASVTGGAGSPVLPLLLLVPVEAALSGRWRIVAGVGIVCAGVVAALVIMSMQGVLASQGPGETIGAMSGEVLALSAGLVFCGLLAARLVAELSLGRDRLEAAQARCELFAARSQQIVAQHGEGGSLVSVSPNVRQLIGLTPNACLGDGLFARLQVADRPAYLKAISDTAADGRRREVAVRMRCGSALPGEAGTARYRWLAMTFLRETDPKGGLATVVSVLRDLEAMKALEAERDEALEKVNEASRAQSRLFAAVSHELRTPLNAIIGFSDVLRQTPNDSVNREKISEYGSLVHDSGSHLLGIVDHMFDLARIEAGCRATSIERFDVAAFLESCRSMMATQADRASLRLSLEFRGELGQISADPLACRQIMLNLISNAIKFTPAGGCVVVFARKERGRLLMGVRDTGIGMAIEDLKRVLEPFVQAGSVRTRTQAGGGLGLSVAKSLVDLHKGNLILDSRLGAGTCVTVCLPLEDIGAGSSNTVMEIPAAPVVVPDQAVSACADEPFKQSA